MALGRLRFNFSRGLLWVDRKIEIVGSLRNSIHFFKGSSSRRYLNTPLEVKKAPPATFSPSVSLRPAMFFPAPRAGFRRGWKIKKHRAGRGRRKHCGAGRNRRGKNCNRCFFNFQGSGGFFEKNTKVGCSACIFLKHFLFISSQMTAFVAFHDPPRRGARVSG